MTSSDLASHITKCAYCVTEVITAKTEKGREIDLNAEPLVGGKFALHHHDWAKPLATCPPLKLAFGRKLYTEHKCTGRAAARRRGVR